MVMMMMLAMMTTEASTEQPAAFLSCSGQPQKKSISKLHGFCISVPSLSNNSCGD